MKKNRSTFFLLAILFIITILFFMVPISSASLSSSLSTTKTTLTPPNTNTKMVVLEPKAPLLPSYINYYNRYCNSSPSKFPPSICDHLRHLRPLSLSGSSVAATDIDPRFGVEKRLVPSGPNPLHN